MSSGYAILHAHSHHSLLDSPLTVSDLVDGAAAAGADAVALTDHGTCTGWIEFLNCCAARGIKGIPGVEAYVRTTHAPRAHLVLLAKNYEGYREISRFMRDGHTHQERLYKDVYIPVSPAGSLSVFFGNGNVIATTACISGPGGGVILQQNHIRREIEKTRELIERHISSESPAYLEMQDTIDTLNFKIFEMQQERDALKKAADRKYSAKRKGLARLEPGSEAYKSAKAKLEAEEKETKEAQMKLPEKKKMLAAAKSLRTTSNKKFREMKADAGKRARLEKKAEELECCLLSEADEDRAIREAFTSLKSVFGDDLYVEVQNHGMPEEAQIYPKLAAFARELGISLIAANDVHIGAPEQAETRRLLSSMRFNVWPEVKDSDKEMCLKTYHEQEDALRRILPEDIVREAMDSLAKAADSCDVTIPKEEHFPKYKGECGEKDAGTLLRERAEAAIPGLFPGKEFTDEYRERLDYELSVIHKLGYDDYMLITEENIRFANAYCATLTESGIGYGTGPGRGSAVGSLTAYLLGISKIDPIRYGLIFERFLNKDRVSNPDIDSDFSYEVREAAINHVRELYGDGCVAGIRTAITQSAKAAVHNSARTLGYERHPYVKGGDRKLMEEERRSLVSVGNAICDKMPDAPDVSLKDVSERLHAEFPDGDAALILSRAEAAEGTITSMGMHPAGLLISDGTPLEEYVPLSLNAKENKWVAQCDMTEAESIGLLKMDFLGLNTLDIITECIRRVHREYDVRVDPDRIPFEPAVFRSVFAKGETACVFQFESDGMKNMLRRFKPSCFEDIILLVAAYRPGPIEFIPEIIETKNRHKHPHYIIKELEGILGTTYGKPIYQEQLMQIFHDCAGFSMGEADIIRRYMAKKKVDKFLSYKERFVNGVRDKGASAAEAEELWDSLTDFAHYAFNKSHAAAYAFLSYQTAWLKHHYPLQFMLAALNHPRSTDKIPPLLTECRRMGIGILPPDINRSARDFEQDGGSIRFGLGSVRGVDSRADEILAERQAHGAFRDFTDFICRWNGNRTVVRALIDAGAFDAPYAPKMPIMSGRPATIRGELAAYYENARGHLAKIGAKEELLRELGDGLLTAKAAERKLIKQKEENARAAIKDSMEEIDGAQINCLHIDKMADALRKEKEMLGAYVSGHPLDGFSELYDSGAAAYCAGASHGHVHLLGIVSGLRFTKRRADGAPMAFFNLDDASGRIRAACFAEHFGECRDVLEEDAVISAYGEIRDDRNGQKQLVMQKASKAVRPHRYVILSVSCMDELKEYRDALRDFEAPDGSRLLILDKTDGHLNDAGITVSINAPGRLADAVRQEGGNEGADGQEPFPSMRSKSSAENCSIQSCDMV